MFKFSISITPLRPATTVTSIDNVFDLLLKTLVAALAAVTEKIYEALFLKLVLEIIKNLLVALKDKTV